MRFATRSTRGCDRNVDREKVMLKRSLAVFTLCAAMAQAAEESFPAADWQDRPNPLASPDAVVGGAFTVYVGPYPKSFNYYLDLNVFSSELFGAMYETLLSQDPVTLALEPGVAESWTISDDKMTYTFKINAKAAWSDGQPMTAHDVLWTWQTILKPENMTGPHKIDLERFAEPEVVDDHTIRFQAREAHWKNLLSVGFLQILPKHAYEGQDFNKINFEFPVVSGRYRLGEIKEGIYAKLERRDDWWNRESKRTEGTANFQTLKFMFYEQDDNAFEAFKKGLLDYYPVHKAHLWVSLATGERFDRNWIVKQKVQNYNPVGFQGFAMNARKSPFDDLRVRQAMAQLLNRERMNETLMHNQYFLHRSFYEDLYDAEHPCPNPLITFDKEKARALLKEAGWVANESTGILEKDGKPFTFEFLTRDSNSDKFLVIYKEDLKDVGIEMSINQKDWAAWLKDMDEFNYDMTWAAWGGSVWRDPESMWSSKEADRTAGQNVTGFKDERVDALIEKQKTIFDLQARNEIIREIDGIVYAAQPYVLLWNLNYSRILYWNKFGTPDTVLGKYGDERAAYWYWWNDEDAAAELEQAQADGVPLPAKPAMVTFD